MPPCSYLFFFSRWSGDVIWSGKSECLPFISLLGYTRCRRGYYDTGMYIQLSSNFIWSSQKKRKRSRGKSNNFEQIDRLNFSPLRTWGWDWIFFPPFGFKITALATVVTQGIYTERPKLKQPDPCVGLGLQVPGRPMTESTNPKDWSRPFVPRSPHVWDERGLLM